MTVSKSMHHTGGYMAAIRPTAALGACAVLLATLVVTTAGSAQAQQPPTPPAILSARIVVPGEGSVTVPPDYAEITSGVTTRAKTAQEATAANAKAMTAIDAALQKAGVAQNDVQTARFSVSPVYGSPQPNGPPKLVGYSAANEIRVKVRQIATVGAVLDALIAAGATDAGSVQFLHSDLSKTLDQARQAAVADARRKAEIYARASGLTLGNVAWITEGQAYTPPTPFAARTFAAAAATPIEPGEDTLRVQITVGFDVVH
jgi:uncharacterized protein